jgi:hypothetical protein
MVIGYTKAEEDILLATKAPVASPAFSGVPTAPTAAAGTSSTQLATTEFVTAANNAQLVSPALTGAPTAPTQYLGHNDTLIATTAFVVASVKLAAPINSPTFTGTVSGITPAMVGLGNVNNTADATKFAAYGVYPVLRYTGTAWPSRALPSGYTGPVKWSSATYANVSAPTGAVDGDEWERQRAS